jgi:hypothetical protein
VSRRSRPRSNRTEARMVRNLDLLSQFDDYTSDIIPLLRQAIKEGWTSDRIRSHPKIMAMVTARTITIALQDPDPSKALAAAKEVIDRAEGKAVERRENTHKLEKLPDEQLDAMLLSAMGTDDASDEEQPH